MSSHAWRQRIINVLLKVSDFCAFSYNATVFYLYLFFLQFRLFNVWNYIRDDPNKVCGYMYAILWNAQTEVIHLADFALTFL